MSLFGRIREGLARTTQQIVGRFEEIVARADGPGHRGAPVDADTIEALEELLISADVGLAATDRILAAVRERGGRDAGLRDRVKQELRSIFAETTRPAGNGHAPPRGPHRGGNGPGQTTTIGKAPQPPKSRGG